MEKVSQLREIGGKVLAENPSACLYILFVRIIYILLYLLLELIQRACIDLCGADAALFAPQRPLQVLHLAVQRAAHQLRVLRADGDCVQCALPHPDLAPQLGQLLGLIQTQLVNVAIVETQIRAALQHRQQHAGQHVGHKGQEIDALRRNEKFQVGLNRCECRNA